MAVLSVGNDGNFERFLTSGMSQTTKPCYCIITLRYALLQGYMRVGYSPLYIIMNSWFYIAPPQLSGDTWTFDTVVVSCMHACTGCMYLFFYLCSWLGQGYFAPAFMYTVCLLCTLYVCFDIDEIIIKYNWRRLKLQNLCPRDFN